MRRHNKWKKSTRDIKILPRQNLRYRLREGCFIFTLAFSTFLFIALLSYHQSDPGWSHSVVVKHVANLTGRAGAWLSDFILYMVGYLAYVFPFMIAFPAFIFFRDQYKKQNIPTKWSLLSSRIIGFLLILSAGSALVAIHFRIFSSHLPFTGGGIIGMVITQSLFPVFNIAGTSLILNTFLLIGITLFTGLSWFQFLELLGINTIKLIKFCVVQVNIFSWKKLFRFFLLSAIHLIKAATTKKIKRLNPDFTLDALDILAKPKIAERPNLDIIDHELKTQRFKGSAVLPNLSLLDKPSQDQVLSYSEEKLQKRSREVELRLADFGILAKVVAVHSGPVVTRFELQLAAGTKANRVTNLAKDLARSLSVISVRIVEVIPGKSVIGLELPNKYREIVTLYEVLATKQYQNSSSTLTLVLGKDIGGHPVIVDLAKMPHLLVAGTTGSGKSVSLNAMLLGLLYKLTPQQLRLILIDPKMLELSVYEGIPHLLTPVVTDMKDAASALRWCVVEMERRYRLMASLGVRNILGYNAKVREAIETGNFLLDPLQSIDEGKSPKLQELPQLVVIADEFADMMVVVGKEVETFIVRLAQKARAAGIHLIFATQRPSVDVITGLIKANIPTRVAFQVSSKIDSRTILDQQGAEQLLGHGDLLYLAPGSGAPVRVHGPYVKDEEVHRVTEYLRESSEANYMEGILDEKITQNLSGFVESALNGRSKKGGGKNDPLYTQAMKSVISLHRVSVSSIQHRFKIGYNRAARIVKAMEIAGIVSSIGNNGTREVLVSPKKE